MNKAYKFRLYPNKEQRVLLAKTFGATRFIYNKMLEDKIKHYEETKTTLNNTPAQYKKEFDWLKEVDSLALANAQMNLQSAYRNFFRDKKVGFPQYKSKHKSARSYTTNCVNGNIKIQDGCLVLPKLKAVKMKQHRVVPSEYVLKSATISQNPSGQYFASLLYEYEAEVTKKEIKTSVGLDFSMKELYVASDNTTAEYPRYYRLSLEKLKREQRKLSLMQKGSQNRQKQKIKVARLHAKVSNQRKDFLHKKFMHCQALLGFLTLFPYSAY